MVILSLAKIFSQNVAVDGVPQIWDHSWIDSTLSANVNCTYDDNLNSLQEKEKNE